ncbi:MAG: 23S rRNA (pseudouridine(1915)-N(3))-methyltransferase RlmH, partial [Alphaproteobacteria bacterium]
MRIVIAAVGRLRRGPEFDLVETYRRRMHWPVSIREVEERRPLAAAERQRREADLLRAAVP